MSVARHDFTQKGKPSLGFGARIVSSRNWQAGRVLQSIPSRNSIEEIGWISQTRVGSLLTRPCPPLSLSPPRDILPTLSLSLHPVITMMTPSRARTGSQSSGRNLVSHYSKFNTVPLFSPLNRLPLASPPLAPLLWSDGVYPYSSIPPHWHSISHPRLVDTLRLTIPQRA